MFEFDNLAPNAHGTVAGLKASQWAFEGKWDYGCPWPEVTTAPCGCGPAAGASVTASIRNCGHLRRIADHHVVLAAGRRDSSGVLSFSQMQNRGPRHPCRVLGVQPALLDGRALLTPAYQDRRKLLETLANTTSLTVPGAACPSVCVLAWLARLGGRDRQKA